MPPNDDGILQPIQVGKALTDTDLHMQPDNSLNGQPCDNISSKNPSYSELTAIYWAWKNLKKLYPDVRYVGLFHYRRFLAFDEQKFFAPNIAKPEEAIINYSLDPQMIASILESGKIILGKRYVFPCTVAAHYCMCHFSGHYRTAARIIREQYPEYYEAFFDVMEHSNKLSACNLFIMKLEDFERYCEWLFAVLSDIENDTQFQQHKFLREPGYLAERLFNVYIRKNRIRVKYFNIYSYGGEPDTRSSLIKFLSCIRRGLSVSKCNTAMFILSLSLKPIRRLLKKYPPKP